MKKVLIGLGLFVAFFVVSVLSLPFFIDVNNYKSSIEDAVNSKINGTFSVQSMKLKGLSIHIQNIKVESSGQYEEKRFLSVGDVKVKLSFLSLLTFSPRATVVLENPEIYLVKNEKGILNVTALPVNQADAPTSMARAKRAQKPVKVGLPALLLGTRLSFVAQNATLKYIDEKANSKTAVEDLDIALNNIGLNQNIDFDIKAHLSSASSEASLIDGDFSLKGTSKVNTGSNHKLRWIELNADLALGEFNTHLEGNIDNIETLNTNLKVSTTKLSLAKLKKSFRPLKAYNVDGTFMMDGKVSGPLKDYDKCEVDLNIESQLSSGKSNLEFKSTLKNTLSHLKSTFSIQASFLDLDAILPKKSANTLETLVAWMKTKEAVAEEKKSDLFKTLSESEILKGLQASGNMDIDRLMYRKTAFNNIKGVFSMKNLRFKLSQFGLEAFEGTLKTTGGVDLSESIPAYRLQTNLNDFQVNKMLTTASPVLKDVFLGVLTTDMNLKGKGLSFGEVKQHLSGKGKINIESAELKGLNMGETLKAQLALISVFAGSDILNENLEGKINYIRSSLVIRQGKLYSPDGTLDAPGYKATLKGFASFDKDINYSGEVLLPSAKLSRTLASLADKNGDVGFPFLLSGRLPKFKFDIDTAKVAEKAARSKIREQVKGKIGDKIKEKFGIDLPIDLPF